MRSHPTQTIPGLHDSHKRWNCAHISHNSCNSQSFPHREPGRSRGPELLPTKGHPRERKSHGAHGTKASRYKCPPWGAAPSPQGTSGKFPKTPDPTLPAPGSTCMMEKNLDFLPRPPRSFRRCLLLLGILFIFSPQLLAELFQQQEWMTKG